MTEHDQHRQDLYSGSGIEWRWVLVGALIVLGLETIFATLLSLFGMSADGFAGLLLTSTLGFFFGGMLTGMMSPGYTAWEGGMASLLAALASVFVVARLLGFGDDFLRTVPIGAAWGMLCGLAGGRVGEFFQERGG